MVVSVSDLDCLDLLIWLRTGTDAATRLNISQPKVSRSIQKVCRILDISISKIGGEWFIKGDDTLLNLERDIHQRFRIESGLPLRLEAQYYSGPLFCSPVPSGWTAGNFDYLEVDTPLRHLLSGVIDAWIGCYPDIPEMNDPDFVCFDLTRLPTHLVVGADHPLLQLGSDISLDDVRQFPSLALADGAFPKVQQKLQELGLWNLPLQVNRYSHRHWEGRVESDLVVGYATAFSISMLENKYSILPIQIPLEVGDSLVIRRRFADHPRFLELLDFLRAKASDLARQYSDVIIPDHREQS